MAAKGPFQLKCFYDSVLSWTIPVVTARYGHWAVEEGVEETAATRGVQPPAAAVANGAKWGYLRDLNAVLCFPHPPYSH